MKKLNYIILLLILSCSLNLTLHAQNITNHTVAPGETLYGIARKYQINLNDLLKVNPQIQNNSIQIGDVLKVPGAAKTNTNIQQRSQNSSVQKSVSAHPFAGATGSEPVKVEKSTTAQPKQQVENTVQNKTFQTIEHVVQEKQTLYAISKIYNVSIEDIKAWNHLDGTDIKVGSKLVIRNNNLINNVIKENPQPVVKVEAKPLPVQPQPEKKPVVDTPKLSTKPVFPAPSTEAVVESRVNTNSKSSQSQLESAFIEAKNNGLNLQSSRTTISWINTENAGMGDSFFALHKTAPVGTILKVTNLVNKRVVFVKVIGKLPETSDNLNIGFRLSAAAKKSLLLNGDKAYVDAEFYK
ncbi:MAG: LysM peptidoglycan-binding domain-containing protein [Chitinophagales bacterium]|nr:LysM peptidoglycan-binding domain-containing protein [Chitinophagales bacterium]